MDVSALSAAFSEISGSGTRWTGRRIVTASEDGSPDFGYIVRMVSRTPGVAGESSQRTQGAFSRPAREALERLGE
jgi:hypothetical protein